MTTVKKATKKVAKKVPPLKLVVGGVYKTYGGHRAEVVAKLKGGVGEKLALPFLVVLRRELMGDSYASYSPKGFCLGSHGQSSDDLVKRTK